MTGSIADDATAVLFDAPLAACTALAEGSASAAAGWLEWQRALWLPLVEMQLRGMQRWEELTEAASPAGAGQGAP
jgi:hypothetical protein